MENIHRMEMHTVLTNDAHVFGLSIARNHTHIQESISAISRLYDAISCVVLTNLKTYTTTLCGVKVIHTIRA